MEIVVVDYRLCAFEYSFHAHRPISSVFPKLAQLLLKNKVRPSKLVFAVDIGTSKRRSIYPEYKLHRQKIQAKETPAEQKRRAQFERDYKASLKWLSNIGTVIDIYGVEADDIGAIIAHRFADTKYQVTLVTSDKDWASFLVADNIRILHVKREHFITRKSCINEYEMSPEEVFLVQCFAGSAKENVKGIHKFGEKTFHKIYEEALDKSFLSLKKIIKEDYLDKKYRGMCLPEGVTSYDNMCEMNYDLFLPNTIESLEEDEQNLFLEKFKHTPSTSYEEFVLMLLLEYDLSFSLTPQERSIFKLK